MKITALVTAFFLTFFSFAITNAQSFNGPLKNSKAFDVSQPQQPVKDLESAEVQKPTRFVSSVIHVQKGRSFVLPVNQNANKTQYAITNANGTLIATGTGTIDTKRLPRTSYKVALLMDPNAEPLTMVID